MREQACATIPTHVALAAAAWWAHAPAHGCVSTLQASPLLKKNPPLAPLFSAASLCLLPLMVNAQSTPSAPEAASAPQGSSQISVPSAPAIPQAPSIPTSPSQPTGVPRPTSYWPGTAFEPAGTQMSTVSADATAPAFQIRALGGFEHQSNALATSTGSQSDTVRYAGVGLRADRRYGLQRLRADVEANTYRYNNHSELDYSVFNYALAWDWSVTTKWHGVLSADRKQYQEVTTDPVSFASRVGKRTEESEGADAIYELGAAWRLLAGVAHTQSTSTQPATWDASPSVNSARVGVGYEFGSGTKIFAHYRQGNGSYKDPTAGAAQGDFRDRETDVQLTWPITAKTTFDGRIGYLKRDNDTAKQSDFSGAVGNAAVNWDITGKTRLMGGYARDLSTAGFGAGGYVASDRFYLSPIWKATAQIALNLRYEHVARDWKSVPAGSAQAGRNEKLNVWSAGVDWEPRRWLAVSGYVRSEKQSSNLNAGYRNTVYGAAAKAYFW